MLVNVTIKQRLLQYNTITLVYSIGLVKFYFIIVKELFISINQMLKKIIAFNQIQKEERKQNKHLILKTYYSFKSGFLPMIQRNY